MFPRWMLIGAGLAVAGSALAAPRAGGGALGRFSSVRSGAGWGTFRSSPGVRMGTGASGRFSSPTVRGGSSSFGSSPAVRSGTGTSGRFGFPSVRSGRGTLDRYSTPRTQSGSDYRFNSAVRQRGGTGSLDRYLQRQPTRRWDSGSPGYDNPYYDGGRYPYPYYPYNPYYPHYYPYYPYYPYSPYYSPFAYFPFSFGLYDSTYSYRSDVYPDGSRDEWPAEGNIQLRIEPRDVEVIVDGVPTADNGRAVISLPAGMHRIEIRREGYRPWILDLDVKQGVRYRLEQKLERLPKEESSTSTAEAPREGQPAARPVGELRLDVKPDGAIVDLDGRLLGMASLLEGSQALRRIPLGRHTLRFTLPGYRPTEREIELTASRPAELKIALERE